MAIKLDTFAADFDTSRPAERAMLAKLQANILKPHGRNYERHVFLEFTAAAGALRAWIGQSIAPRIRSADSQYPLQASNTDDGTVITFFLSAQGYEKLGLATRGFDSDAFLRGMKDRSDSFLDRLIGVENKDRAKEHWEPSFQGAIHALVAVADDDPAQVEAVAQQIRAGATGIARVLGTEHGNVLRRLKPGRPPEWGDPVEHFGYRDGISQPLFTAQDLAKASPPAGFKRWDPSARLSLVLVDDPLTDEPDAFGSYLVYRKLGQQLARFDQQVALLAAALDVTPELAGAYVVGRFKDGTPVVQSKTPTGNADNDFDFANDDPKGERCPPHAHIRKANPRGTTPLTSLASERRRRIARRGIPYGPPLGREVADHPASDPNPELPRGLLFQCFQANIEDQFEFLQRTWIDNVIFPRGFGPQTDTGDDPLIGQDSNEAQRWPKEWGDAKEGTRAINFDAAVRLRGGEYFFAPSLPFLRALK